RNAIVALSDRIVKIWALNGFRPGLTVSPGVIHGGTVANTVPGHASCQVDVRVARAVDVEAFDLALQDILAASIIPDVRFHVEKHLGMPPLEKTEASVRLVGLARRAAEEIGFAVEDTATGGGSDGAYAAAAGADVLDGLGPVGGGAHSEREYVEIDTIVPRTAMVSRLITLV
ncbi:MAG TPA: M20/M25/M40 family metallo-hydrolase, partial [Chloroflexota bacterium]|nr:M20/M25/M40 family metallo-hydrolase [Chloroflexota bacterium]